MLSIGAKAPYFFAHGTDGEVVSSDHLLGKRTILYFFHRAGSPNCTIEAKGFRDNHHDLAELGIRVVGVSTDTAERQCRFVAKIGMTYPVIADSELTISKRYDVLWPILPLARRVAYAIDEKQVIRGAWRHEFSPTKHLDEILAFARSWGALGRGAHV